MEKTNIYLASVAILLLGASGSWAGESDATDTAAPGQALATGQPEWKFEPYAVVVGGLQHEAIWNQKGFTGSSAITDGRGDRFVTLALSRFGIKAGLGEHVSIESEIEVNAGAYGTSVWEGQAALQVNNQALRLSRWGAGVTLGRLTDPASVDLVSEHVADQLLMDRFTRIPMLESGYNRGNGILFDYQPIKGLKAGITVNSSSPLSTTGGYLIAGKYSDGQFSRFYLAAGELILNSANRYPADNTHLMVLTPSVVYRHELFEAQAAVQMLWANVDVNKTTDDTIFGTNFRVGARGKLLNGMLQPFVNFSLLRHNTHNYQAEDQGQLNKTWEGEDWQTMVVTGGVDVNYLGRNGVGLQYSYIGSQQGEGDLIQGAQHYINLGTTWWVTDTIALGARLAFWLSDFDDQTYVGSEWVDKHVEEGRRAIYFTLRKVL